MRAANGEIREWRAENGMDQWLVTLESSGDRRETGLGGPRFPV